MKDVEEAQGIEVVPASTPHEALAGCQLVITATPTTARSEVLEAGWLEPGQVIVSIDYDCYWTPGALGRLEAVFTDDLAQFEKSREYGGYYRHLHGAPRELLLPFLAELRQREMAGVAVHGSSREAIS